MKNYKQNIILMSLLNENKIIDFFKNVSGASNFDNARINRARIEYIKGGNQIDEHRVSSKIKSLKRDVDWRKDDIIHTLNCLNRINNIISSGELSPHTSENKAELERMLKDDEEKYKKAKNALNRYTRRANKVINKIKSNRMNQISDLEGAIKKDMNVGYLKARGLKTAAALAAAGYGIKKIVDWRKKKKKERE